MSTVSLTLPADGDTIDAADVNTPLNAIAAVINGGIDSTNATDGGLTPADLVSGTGSSWAWQTWTPTWTNLTVGNGTQVAGYIQIGKTVFYRLRLTLGSTSSVTGAFTVAPPVTINTAYAGSSEKAFIGMCKLLDSGIASYSGYVLYATGGTDLQPVVQVATGTYVTTTGANGTVPFSWGNGDEIFLTGNYEVA